MAQRDGGEEGIEEEGHIDLRFWICDFALSGEPNDFRGSQTKRDVGRDDVC